MATMIKIEILQIVVKAIMVQEPIIMRANKVGSQSANRDRNVLISLWTQTKHV